MGRRNLFERIGEEGINESAHWFRAKKETIHLIGFEQKTKKTDKTLIISKNGQRNIERSGGCREDKREKRWI